MYMKVLALSHTGSSHGTTFVPCMELQAFAPCLHAPVHMVPQTSCEATLEFHCLIWFLIMEAGHARPKRVSIRRDNNTNQAIMHVAAWA